VAEAVGGAGAAKRPPSRRPAGKAAASPVAQAAVPKSPPAAKPAVGEPVWLVRSVLVLFLVGFAAFLAREVRGLLEATDASRAVLYWTAVGFGLAVGLVAGAAVAWAIRRRA
jgi:hypothetical protein